MLYFDTEMFRSSKQDSMFEIDKDYKKLLFEELDKAHQNPQNYMPQLNLVKKLVLKTTSNTSQKTYCEILKILIAGDPKTRSYRACVLRIKIDDEKTLKNGKKDLGMHKT